MRRKGGLQDAFFKIMLCKSKSANYRKGSVNYAVFFVPIFVNIPILLEYITLRKRNRSKPGIYAFVFAV